MEDLFTDFFFSPFQMIIKFGFLVASKITFKCFFSPSDERRLNRIGKLEAGKQLPKGRMVIVLTRLIKKKELFKKAYRTPNWESFGTYPR